MKYECLFANNFNTEYPLNSTRPVKDVLINGKSVVNNFDVAVINCEKSIDSIEKKQDYFYALEYTEVDYDYAIAKLKESAPKLEGLCTGFRDGDFLGRNFDWHYNESGQFFVRIAANNGRYASMGIVSNVPGLTKDVIESGKYQDIYALVPFHMVDGINEYNVAVTINVVPKGDKGETTKTVPTEETLCELPFKGVPRYILDHYKTAKEAVEGIEKNVCIYGTSEPSLAGYEIHYLIADKNETYILEVVENNITYRKVGVGCDYPSIMANFYVHGVEVNEDGTVDASPENKSKITLQGCGLERHNVAAAHIGTIDSKDAMKEAMLNKLRYTNAYREETTPIWYTEFVGINGLNVESPREEFMPVVEYAREFYKEVWENKRRDGSIWISAHTSVYDIKEKKLYVYIEEEDKEYEFDFKNIIKIK